MVCIRIFLATLVAAAEGLAGATETNGNPLKSPQFPELANPTANPAVNPAIHPYPADAAFHQRSKQWPLREMHSLTQGILRSILEKKKTAAGTIVTRDASFDMAFEYSIGLHSDLVPLDNLEVLHFEHSDKFAARVPRGVQDSLVPGSILIGSHVGKWSYTAGSKHAILSDSKDANQGGVAYLRRIVGVIHADDGISHVETARVEEADAARIFPRGKIALGWNHTKSARQRVKVDALDEHASSEFLSSIPPESKPDDHANMSHQRRLDYISTFCDSQCSVYSAWSGTAYDYLTEDDENEACVYCFEYRKSIDLFNFNYDGSGSPPDSNAISSPLYPAGPSNSFITCTECYAYLGASAYVLVDWGDRTTFKAGLAGQSGYNFNFKVAPGSGSLSVGRELFRKNTCLPPLTLAGGYVTVNSNCVLKSTVVGQVTALDGQITSSSYLATSATFGGGFEGTGSTWLQNGQWSSVGTSSWAYQAPTLGGTYNSGFIGVTASLRPVVELTVSLGFAGVMTMNFQSSVGIEPVVSLRFDGSSAASYSSSSPSATTSSVGTSSASSSTTASASPSRQLVAASAGSEFIPPVTLVKLVSVFIQEEMQLGGAIDMVVDLLEDTEHVVFDVTSTCWKENLHLTLLVKSLPSGRSALAVPIPWNILFLEAPCEDYTFSAYSAAWPHAISAVDVHSHAPGPCARAALVSSPSDGHVISPTGLLSVAWHPDQLFFMRGSNDAPHGRMVEVGNVTIQIIGTTSLPFDPDLCFGENHTGACVETTTVTPVKFGVPNTGFFAFNLSTNTDGEGVLLPWAGSSWKGRYDRLRVKVIASDHWFTWGYNRGWFTLGDGTATANSMTCDPISTISTASLPYRLIENIAAPATTIPHKRDLALVLVTGGYLLKATANFDRVYVVIIGGLTYDLWEDSDTSTPDITSTLISSITWFESYVGTAEPTVCSAGQYSTSATTCASCPAGKYSGVGATGCLLCLAGKYQYYPEQAECVACIVGSYSATMGATTCYYCSAGNYAAGTGNYACTGCSSGKYSTVTGATSSSDCASCSAGFYQHLAASTACVACPPGSHQPSTGKATCNDCALGTYSSASGRAAACSDMCSVGKYSPTGASACTACPVGSFGIATGVGACSGCLAGTYSTTVGRSSACTDACAAGKYSTNGASSCTVCDVGTYSAAGASSCLACPAGSYSSAPGAWTCELCAVNTYSAAGASACTICNIGRSSDAGSASCIGFASPQPSTNPTIMPSLFPTIESLEVSSGFCGSASLGSLAECSVTSMLMGYGAARLASTADVTCGFESTSDVCGFVGESAWLMNQQGPTPSLDTGPVGAKGGVRYAYVEASGNFPSNTFHMTTEVNGLASIGFSYNMYGGVFSGDDDGSYYYYAYYYDDGDDSAGDGDFMGTLSLEVSANGDAWMSVWDKTGTWSASQNVWDQATITVGDPTIKFMRFKGVTGPDGTYGFRSDMAVDEVNIANSRTEDTLPHGCSVLDDGASVFYNALNSGVSCSAAAMCLCAGAARPTPVPTPPRPSPAPNAVPTIAPTATAYEYGGGYYYYYSYDSTCLDNDARSLFMLNATCVQAAGAPGICEQYFCTDCGAGAYTCDVSCGYCPSPAPNVSPAPIPAEPTQFPIALPTTVPIPSPTKVPVSLPTTVPIPSPTKVPVSLPTTVPIPSPTKVPVSLPTTVPIPSPTPEPTATYAPSNGTPKPTAFPLSQPTPRPTSEPAPQPTTVPTKIPVPFPTQAPTQAPTTADTALVEIVWVMDAAAAPTESDKATLKINIASQLELDPATDMKNFDVASQAVRRLASNVRRRLTPTEQWTVGFDIVSTAEAAAGVAATALVSLAEPTFESAIRIAVPVVELFTPPVAVVQTRSPSPGPSIHPSTHPTVHPSMHPAASSTPNDDGKKATGSSGDDSGTSSASLGIIVGASAAAILSLVGLVVGARRFGLGDRLHQNLPAWIKGGHKFDDNDDVFAIKNTMVEELGKIRRDSTTRESIGQKETAYAAQNAL